MKCSLFNLGKRVPNDVKDEIISATTQLYTLLKRLHNTEKMCTADFIISTECLRRIEHSLFKK